MRIVDDVFADLEESVVVLDEDRVVDLAVALTHTTWADWKMRHPDTLVLSAETGFNRDYSRDPYGGYASSDRIMFLTANTSQRFPPKEPVLAE